MSALGWVARTVLIRGSSTGLTPPPRGAPRRARRRRTPAPPLVPGEGAAVTRACEEADAGGRGVPRAGTALSGATSPFSTAGVTLAPGTPVVATSPATCAPVAARDPV